MSFQDLDIDLLRCFVAVADAKGFTAAGKVLGRTQSAVTIKIQRLEELVDRQLLKRTSRSLSLTGEGELLLGYARRILAGLGVSVLGAHSVQNGMRVVQEELPDLPSIDIILFGKEKFGGAIAKALVNFVLRSVQEHENLATKAA